MNRNRVLDAKLRASYTVEAAVIMPVTLMATAMLISAGFGLHDIVIGNLTANEAAELYGHLPEYGNREEIGQYAGNRLKAVLSDIDYSVTIDEYGDGSRVELDFGEGSRIYEDAGSRPEKLMRQLTLLDAVTDK